MITKIRTGIKKGRIRFIFSYLALLTLSLSCVRRDAADLELLTFPLDDLEGVLTRSGIEVDTRISSDGKGALKINAAEPGIFRLFELGDVDVEAAVLVYQARLRTENVSGLVYLEMLCHFAGKGEFFSRGVDSPLTGTVEWTTQEISFLLRKGENPDNIKLNIVCEGSGTIWVDEVRLVKRSLPEKNEI